MDEQGLGGWVVLEFSGTSVASSRGWISIERAVREALAQDLRVLVVCPALAGVTAAIARATASAQAGEEIELLPLRAPHQTLAATLQLPMPPDIRDTLEELGRELESVRRTRVAGPWVRARCLAAGEEMGAQLAAAWLRSRGLAVVRVDARDLLIAEDSPAALTASAEPTLDPAQVVELSGGSPVVVIQAATAADKAGNTVRLGPDGVGLSGALLAGLLDAERVELWTDTPGLLSADPARCPEARPLPHLGYEEAEAMGALGARGLDPRALAPLRAAGVPLLVRSALQPELPGTRVDLDLAPGPKAVCVRTGLLLLRLRSPSRGQSRLLGQVLASFDKHAISLDLLAHSRSQIALTLDPSRAPGGDMHRMLAELRRLCSVELELGVGSVSVVGSELGSTASALGPLASEVRTHFVAHDPADHHQTWVVDASAAHELGARLHAALLEHEQHAGDRLSAPEAMGA
jgi:diaminopimelate decarboxylase/aspartate kinase